MASFLSFVSERLRGLTNSETEAKKRTEIIVPKEGGNLALLSKLAQEEGLIDNEKFVAAYNDIYSNLLNTVIEEQYDLDEHLRDESYFVFFNREKTSSLIHTIETFLPFLSQLGSTNPEEAKKLQEIRQRLRSFLHAIKEHNHRLVWREGEHIILKRMIHGPVLAQIQTLEKKRESVDEDVYIKYVQIIKKLQMLLSVTEGYEISTEKEFTLLLEALEQFPTMLGGFFDETSDLFIQRIERLMKSIDRKGNPLRKILNDFGHKRKK